MSGALLPSLGQHPGSRFDVLGVALSALGLSALVFGLQNGEQYHWGHVAGPLTIPEIIAVGLILLIVFVAWQGRSRSEPLLPLRLFRYRGFTVSCLAVAFISLAMTALYLPLVLYIQTVLGYSPLMSALITLPAALGASIAGPLSGRLSDGGRARYVAMAGFVVFAVSVAVIATLAGPHTSPWLLRGAMLACGLGAGSVYSPLAGAATSDLPLSLMGAGRRLQHRPAGRRRHGQRRSRGAAGGQVHLRSTGDRGWRDPRRWRRRCAMPTGAARETLLLPIAFTLLGVLVCARLPRGQERPPRRCHRPARSPRPARRPSGSGLSTYLTHPPISTIPNNSCLLEDCVDERGIYLRSQHAVD